MFLYATLTYIFIIVIIHSESKNYEEVVTISAYRLSNHIDVLSDMGNINSVDIGDNGGRLSNVLTVGFDHEELISTLGDNMNVITDATFVLSCTLFQHHRDSKPTKPRTIHVTFIDNSQGRQANHSLSIDPGNTCNLGSFGGSGAFWTHAALSWNITESCPNKDSQIQLDFLPVLRIWSWCKKLYDLRAKSDSAKMDYPLIVAISRLHNDSWTTTTSREDVTSRKSALLDITVADDCSETELGTCNDHSCIRPSERCNFHPDCAMGEDEMRCGLLCDFDSRCDWTSSGFVVTSTEDLTNPILPHSKTHTGRKLGRYALFTSTAKTSSTAELTSPWYGSSGPRCRIQYLINIFGVYVGPMFVQLRTGNIIHEIARIYEERGNKWVQQTIDIGRIISPFQITFELRKGYGYSYIALDEVTMLNCSSDDTDSIQSDPPCGDMEFQCNTSVCIAHDRVCDLRNDCLFGDDEQEGCDKFPAYSQCTFESDDGCGWHNLNGDVFDWVLHKGSTPTKDTGPAYDHTLKNASGHYMYIEASNRVMGDIAVLSSGLLPPPDPRTTPQTSSYFGTCQLRFFYHSYGPHTGALEVWLRSFCEPEAQMLQLGSFSRVDRNQWQRMTVPLVNISTWYSVEFHVTTVPRHMGDIALDDISLTPECFGGGILTNWSHDKIDNNYFHINQSVDRHTLCIRPHIDANISDDISVEPAYVLLGAADAHTNVGMAVTISVALISMVLCLAALVICLRRHHKKISGKHAHEMTDFIAHFQTQMSSSEYNPTYNLFSAGNVIKELREIPRGNIQLIKPLGHGAFGEVYLGHVADLPMLNGLLNVAIKTLQGQIDDHSQEEFIMEAIIMSKFNHPNIVKFYGVCFEGNPKFIILELLEGGDLKNFLKKSRPKLNYPSLLSMNDLFNLAVDIAKGCRYLEECHFIHRDIAARNCLLTTIQPERMAKIADFGMSREMLKEYYRKSGKAMLPIKWMPPEAFLDGTFTSKTDVWSFGVLLWEIFTLGLAPYPGLSNHEVMEFVTGGHRMHAPVNCPQKLYNLMEWCWGASPTGRPTFSKIIDKLQQFQQNPELMSTELPTYYNTSDDGLLDTCGCPDSSNAVQHHTLKVHQSAQVPYYIEPIDTPPRKELDGQGREEPDSNTPLIAIIVDDCSSQEPYDRRTHRGRVEYNKLARSISETEPDIVLNPPLPGLIGPLSSASVSVLSHTDISTSKPCVFSKHASSPSLNINPTPSEHPALLEVPWLHQDRDVERAIASNRPWVNNVQAGIGTGQQNSNDNGRSTCPNKYVDLPHSPYKQSGDHYSHLMPRCH